MSKLSPTLLAAASLPHPHIDFAALSPLIALLGGAVIVLMAGLPRSQTIRRHGVPLLSLVALGATAGLTIWQWQDEKSIVSGALRIDRLALVLNLLLAAAGAVTVLLAWRSGREDSAQIAAGEGDSLEERRVERIAQQRWSGELHALLLSSIAGMALLVAAQNIVLLFLGLELLSIPLYVMCASDRSRGRRREHSLESGLKYLIIGSVGSATLLYGLALIYGATGATSFTGIAHAIASHGLSGNVMLLFGVTLAIAGFCFKSSVAPFHQWTPDVYEGAPTPITTFMAIATKVAALGAFLRFFDVALIEVNSDWGPAIATLAAITIVVGNVGALTQSSLKRMLAYSSVAQAGYMLAGVVVASALGVKATVFYLAVYLCMNTAAFAVIVARERETGLGDSIQAVTGLGRQRPWLAWPLTLSMLGLAGIPATAGFVGKFYLIDAAVSGGYTWLGVVIVIGSMISLAYYLPVIAAIWMREAPAIEPTPAAQGPLPAIAGGSPELDEVGGATNLSARAGQGRVVLVALLGGAATLFFGIVPQPLFDLVQHVGRGFGLF
ncbi:MAG TPA: NADH-quinone oxidoreductase subunit N [Solirubrobacteraceae bacterium]|jgi:NADH-quinone oxidoreductase subunit N